MRVYNGAAIAISVTLLATSAATTVAAAPNNTSPDVGANPVSSSAAPAADESSFDERLRSVLESIPDYAGNRDLQQRVIAQTKQPKSASKGVRTGVELLLDTLKAGGASQKDVDQVAAAGAADAAWAALMERYRQSDPDVTNEPVPPPAGGDVGSIAAPIIQALPSPPAVDDATPVDKQNTANAQRRKDEASKALLSLIAAGVCIAQPEVCPFVALFLTAMGSGEHLQGDIQIVKGISDASRGGKWDDGLDEKIKGRLSDFTTDRRAQDAVGALAKLRELDSQDKPINAFVQAAERAQDELLKEVKNNLSSEQRAALDQILANDDVNDVVRTLRASGDFQDAEAKSRMMRAVSLALAQAGPQREQLKQKYWRALFGERQDGGER